MSIRGAPRRVLVRVLLVAAILGGFLELRWPVGGGAAPPVAVVDVSASVGPGPLAPPADVRIDPTWVAFGAEVRDVEGRSEAPSVPRDETALAEALHHGASRFPGRTLWVFTDGRGTDGDALEAARAVLAAGGRVDVSAPVRPAADVGILQAAAQRLPDGRARVSVRLDASTEGRVRVSLLAEGRGLAFRDVDVRPDTEARLELEDPAPPAGGIVYQVVLQPARGTPDDDAGNDQVTVGLPSSKPQVLVWGDGGAKAWSRPGLGIEARPVVALDPASLAAADLVVTAGVPWSRIGELRTSALVRFVAGGGRLLLLGGPGSWASGGWCGTPFELELAPLRVPVPQGGGLTLLLALDRSGSTSHGALDHLKDAVLGAIGDLHPGERLAVLPFAGAPAPALLAPGFVVGGPGGAKGRAVLARSVAALEAGGATDIPAVLREGARRLADAPGHTRRLVLLTDGDPEHAPDEKALTAARAALDGAGVELRAVVSGMREAARRLRRLVAHRPQDVVLLSEAAEIPDALLRALARSRGERERREAPDAVENVGAGAWPGFAALHPRWIQALELADAGRLLAVARWGGEPAETLPFAARRAVGAGEVLGIAWGPDAEKEPESAAESLTGLVVDLARSADRGLVGSIGEDGRLVVRWPEARGDGRVVALGGPSETTLVETEPGLFEGPSPRGEGQGILVRRGKGGATRPVHLPARPPAEHRGAGVDELALRALAAAGGGLRLPAGALPPTPRAGTGGPVAPWLLVAALVLFIMDRLARERSPGVHAEEAP